MNNKSKTIKTILFVGLIAAMILPFSVMELAEAAPNENANKEHKYESKRNYEKKDHHNYKAVKILEEIESITMKMPDANSTEISKIIDREKIKKLQQKLKIVEKEHIEKIIDKELRKELKKARQLIIDRGIPTKLLATGIDHLTIQLSKDNAKYEEELIELMGDLPYLIEYGEGAKRIACVTTSSNCYYEVGGIKIQIEANILQTGTCSLSVPMKKNGTDGFLTAAHCFTGYSEDVYQPDTSDEDYKLGFSNSTWRSFEHNGECDCAWLNDTSSTAQISGVYSSSNYYYPMFGTDSPVLGETVKLRAYQSSTGTYQEIENDDITIPADILYPLFGNGATINLMSFVTPVQPGDSGGSVVKSNKYSGIVVGVVTIDEEVHALFVPWDHITENISGLELTVHP